MIDRARVAVRSLAELFFPAVCAGCGGELEGTDCFCRRCAGQVCEIGIDGGCIYCKAPLHDGGSCSGPVHACAAYRFEGPVADAIKRAKYGGRPQFIARLARRGFAGTMPALDREPFDIVTAVPLAGAKLRKRGFNQAHLTAVELLRSAGYQAGQKPELELLRRRKGAKDVQASLGYAARRENALRAFKVTGKAPARIEGKRVLLVDDVITTGATLAACAKLLRDAGASAVCALALAHTPASTDIK